MIEDIKELRAKVPVSLAVAKELVERATSLEDAIEQARVIYTEAVTAKTGASVDEAYSALDRTKGDVSAAIEFIGWRTDFAGKEKAGRPTKTETRKAIKGTYTLYDLMNAVGTDDDLTECPSSARPSIRNLFAINTFHSLYTTDTQLLFREYVADLPIILNALQVVGLTEQASHLEREIKLGGQSDEAFQEYTANERGIHRAVRSYCEANLADIHDWLYRNEQ